MKRKGFISMKIRTTRYIIKEGLINVYRNKLMSMASLSVVIASLIIFGIFLLITLNLNYNVSTMEKQSQMQVYCEAEIEDSMVNSIEKKIKNSPYVKDYVVVSKEEAYEIAKEMLGNQKEALTGFDESIMPVSFKINLKNAEDCLLAEAEFKKISGVSKVKFSYEKLQLITKVVYIIQLISVLLIIILVLFSVLIISNTIKIAVFSRRKEIEIMKYIGATDWFIRWPFIVEGIAIGLIGAGISYVAVSYAYMVSAEKIHQFITMVNLLNINNMSSILIIGNIILGVLVGAFGSAVSIRKYLRV